ncbi:hypothetical protein M8C13_32465 [Crossiella sp. SN42]|uniref:hypothetical protein n=1 Tax=Crossiella sp. SN42 TaxID=2944808 RepID=UPI00207D3D97|nr:hypothetical protein [Crossiella sp. SN42]MCO1580478.1 hypothetical protein [Crossiella sp. SN42]
MASEVLPHGPAATDAIRWRTVRPLRTVLAIARTLTSAIRLLEATPVFQHDPRVQLVFTVDPGSRFSTGVHDLLHRLQAQVVLWAEVSGLDCDLVITASENAGFDRLGQAPILVLPHGIGFHKFVPASDRDGTRLSGLVNPELVRAKQIIHLVTHPDQEAQLRAASPATAGRVVVGGDLSLDGLLAGEPFRDDYRRRIGVRTGQRLVVISSTWGEESVLGGFPTLPDRLLAELPADQYRVAMILHPNAWTWHGRWQVRQWLDNAVRGGLALIPPNEGWHATVIAADAVIGDHGSVGLYSAITDRPFLLAAFGSEVVPGTPLADFGRFAQRLDHGAGLQEQVDKAIATQQAGQFRSLAERLFSLPGEAARTLRGICYDLMDLSEPDIDLVLDAVPAPVAEQRPVHSFEVLGELLGQDTVMLHRFPASVRHHRPPAPPEVLRHLAVDTEERSLRLYWNASVIVCADTSTRAAGNDRVDDLQLRFPGCAVTAVATVDGCLTRIRDWGTMLVTTEEGAPDPMVAASALHVLWCADQLQPGRFVVRDGVREHRLILTPG